MPVSEFRKTIKGRLLIYTGFSTLMIMLIIAVFYSFTREHLIKDVEKEIMNGVKLFALNIENANRESIKVAETIAHVQEHGFLGKRTQSTAFIRTILQNHPQFTGIYLGYEANADQNDAAYLANNPSEQKAMDKNGRYLPYWFIKNSKIELTALVDMETSLYYQGTKEKYHSNAKDKSNITEPYFYEGKMIVEYTYPISIGNEFLGVAGVDRALTDMLYLLSSFKPYKSSNFVLISAKGRIISSNMDLGTTETVQSVLKKQEKDINARQVDNKMLTFHLDETNFAPLLDHFYQMEIDSTETEIYRDQENRIFHYAATKIKTGNWTLVMGVAEDEVYGPIYDLLWEILAILFVILMLLIFMAIKLSKKISQPVTDLIVAASNLAKGNFDIHLPDFSITEINNLKKTLVDTAIELKKLTSNLEAEKERLFVTFRSIGDAVITTDTSGRLTLMNRIAEQLTGWKNNEAQGRPLDEVFPIINELTRLKIESPVAEVLKTGKIVGLAKYTVLISRDGTEYQLADSAAAIRDSQNNITGAVLVFRDVTGESLMQKELIESEKRYRFLAEQPGQMIYDYNLLNGNIDWSGDIEGVTGFTADEFQNVNIESWGKMIHPDDQKNALELLGTGMKEKGHYDPTYRFKCKDGSFKFIEESGYFLANKNEKPHQMLGIMKDISTRIQSEKDLQESEEKFRTIFENAPILIDSFDQSGRCTLWNKECENVYGWTIEELNSADDALSLIYPNPDMRNRVISSVISMPDNKFREWPATTKSGKEVIVLWANFKIRDGSIISLGYDITESKLSEEKNRRLQEQLGHSRKMDAIGQLAGGVAHDFNNMLGGIMGAAQLLKSSGRALDEKSLKFVDIIISASTRAADLTTKLLAFGRKGKIISTAVDIHNIIDDTVAIMSKTIDKKITIHTKEQASCHSVIGDNTAIQNALINMGLNASYAMENGGELSFITTNIRLDKTYCDASSFEIEPGEYISITVRDSGSGIEPEKIDRIFEPFFTTRKQGEGTGLGLASVYGTVQNHLGEITVSSKLNEGTLFTMLLPCTSENVPIEKKEPEIATGTGTILLIDDEEIIRITGKQMLKEMGFNVILATDGFEGMEVFKKQHNEIDLVITDMVMPKMNGREAFFKMKEIDNNCKVIISSGFTKDESLNDMKKAGLAGYIHKPFRDVELNQLLTKVLTEKPSR